LLQVINLFFGNQSVSSRSILASARRLLSDGSLPGLCR
jgi:hypothetical protein